MIRVNVSSEDGKYLGAIYVTPEDDAEDLGRKVLALAGKDTDDRRKHPEHIVHS